MLILSSKFVTVYCFCFKSLCKILDLQCEFVFSSDLANDKKLKGQCKIIDICNLLKADTYINLIGGQDLYSKEEFFRNRIELRFHKMRNIKYDQNCEQFVSNLSIIDVIASCGVDMIKNNLLNEYDLIGE